MCYFKYKNSVRENQRKMKFGFDLSLVNEYLRICENSPLFVCLYEKGKRRVK